LDSHCRHLYSPYLIFPTTHPSPCRPIILQCVSDVLFVYAPCELPPPLYFNTKCIQCTHPSQFKTDADADCGLCSVLLPRQHSIGYMGDGFYRSKDPTNSVKVLKEKLQRKNQKKRKKTKYTYAQTIIDKKRIYTYTSQQVP